MICVKYLKIRIKELEKINAELIEKVKLLEEENKEMEFELIGEFDIISD